MTRAYMPAMKPQHGVGVSPTDHDSLTTKKIYRNIRIIFASKLAGQCADFSLASDHLTKAPHRKPPCSPHVAREGGDYHGHISYLRQNKITASAVTLSGIPGATLCPYHFLCAQGNDHLAPYRTCIPLVGGCHSVVPVVQGHATSHCLFSLV